MIDNNNDKAELIRRASNEIKRLEDQIDTWKNIEKDLKKKCEEWKEVGANLYMVLKVIKIHIEEDSSMYKIMTDAMSKYENLEDGE